MKSLVSDGDDALISLGTTLCTSSTEYNEEFCSGVVEREAPVIADIIRTMDLNSTTSTQFCITFLGVCDVPKVQAWNIPFESKRVCDAKPPKNSGKKPLKVIHYSDIHIDPLYVKGANTECELPTCCR